MAEDGMPSDGSLIPDEDIRDGVLMRCSSPQALQAFLDSGDGVKEAGEEGHQWSEGAVNTLLGSYGTRWHLCMRGNIKKAQWEEIAAEVSSRSHGGKASKTRGQCKSKVEKLKRKFREEKQLMEKTGKTRSKWPYYSQMEVIMGNGQRYYGSIPNALDGGHPAMAEQRLFAAAIPAFKDNCTDILKADYMFEGHLQDLPLSLNDKEVVSDEEDDEDESDGDDSEEDENDEDASCSTPKKREREAANNGNHVRGKGKGKGLSGKECLKRRKSGGDSELAAAVKSFGETIFKIEQSKMEIKKEADRMRVQMELKRTEMLMNAQMQIARIFCASFKKKAKKKIITSKLPSMN